MPSFIYKRASVFFAITTFIFSNVSLLFGQSFSWRSITFLGEVRDILRHSDDIWAATGGGIFAYSIANNSFKVLNNTFGLSSNNPSSFVLDNEGNFWVGMDDGSLNVIPLDDGTIRRVPIDPEPISIHDVVFYENSLYLALNIGVSQFLIAKEEIRATFRNLGDFVSNTPVQRLFVVDGRIWVGTARGIATAELSSPNLQDPQFWKNFTTQDGLPSNTITDFVAKGDTVLVATGNGIARIVNNTVQPEGLARISVNRMTDLDGTVYAATGTGVFRRESPGSWIELTPHIRDVISFTLDNEGLLWAGHAKLGMFVYDETVPKWINVFPPGPGGNSFEEMTFDLQNRLWIATGQSSGNGVYIFDGFDWDHITVEDGLVSNNTIGAAVDPRGRVWIGTPGQGLMILEKQNEFVSVEKVDTTDNRLSGAVTPDFVVVSTIVRAPDNTMWLVNKFADNGRAIVAITPDDTWHYFSVTDGLTSTAVSDIVFDGFGRLWIATENNGVDRLDYRGTLDEKSDDLWEHLTTGDGLKSNRITALAADREFGMWIGTEEGINLSVEGLPVQNIRGVIDNSITEISVDPANNKWFGTRSGISILAPDNFTWTHLTADNSDLVANNIVSIIFNEKTGDAFVGTGEGLSIVSTPYKQPPVSFNDITVYPNPFILDGSGTRLTIDNILLNSTVIISTLSGNVLRKLTIESGNVLGTQAFWDGRDDDQNIVPSGIYIVAAGLSGQGHGSQKVAVIRK